MFSVLRGRRLSGTLDPTYASPPREYDWLLRNRLLACIYPANDAALRTLAGARISLLIVLTDRAHDADALAAAGLRQLHLPVRDFAAPTPVQLDAGVQAIEAELRAGGEVAVHCRAGLGRTGTLLACYLVAQGLSAECAIARVRRCRPGSIESWQQAEAVRAFAASRQQT
jgi:atypical dual specificity phosphatase